MRCPLLRTVLHVCLYSGLLIVSVVRGNAEAACAGDCDGSGGVAINELIVMVRTALGAASVSTCEAGDLDRSGDISIAELITAVNVALHGCVSSTPTTNGSVTPTQPSPTATEISGATATAAAPSPVTERPTEPPTAIASTPPTASPPITASHTPTIPSGFVTMQFQNEIVTDSSISVPVALDGTLDVSETGSITGLLTTTFGAGGTAIIVGGGGSSLTIQVGSSQFELLPNDADFLLIDGVRIPVSDALATSIDDRRSDLGPEQWSVAGQASLALSALATTSSWRHNVSVSLELDARGSLGHAAALGQESDSSEPSAFCKGSAYVAAWILGAGGTAAACTALAPGCLVPIVNVVSCPAVAGICGAMAAASYDVAFRLVLALWGPSATPTVTASPTATPLQQSAFCNGCCSEMLNGCPVVRVDDQDEVRCMSGCDCNQDGAVSIAELILSGCSYSGAICLEMSPPKPHCGF